MKKYPKIQSLFKRDQYGNVTNQLTRPEFDLLRCWVVEEKLDGMNAKLIFSGDNISWGGKSEKSEIPSHVDERMAALSANSATAAFRMMEEFGTEELVLFGEAYGPKIQSGGKYRDDVDFIVFDILADGKWLSVEEVTEACDRIGIDRVPIIGAMGTYDVCRFVEQGFNSQIGKQPQAEGIVARPPQPLYDRRGHRLMFKLKTEDFK